MAFVPGKLEHSVAIGVDTSLYYDNDKGFRRRTFYRFWRSLTCQQKSIFILLAITLISLLYIFFLKTRVPIRELEADKEHKPHLFPLKNPRKINREEYMRALHKKLDDKIRPLKRGPPKRKLRQRKDEHNDNKPFIGRFQINEIDKKYDIQMPENKKKKDGANVLSDALKSENNLEALTVTTVQNIINVVKKSINSRNDGIIKESVVNRNNILNKISDLSKTKINSNPNTVTTIDPEKESEKDINVYLIGKDGKRIDKHKDEKRKALLARYVAITGVDYARHPEKLSLSVRQKAVVAACRHAWNGYKKFAWGYDELKPMTQGHAQWFMLGLTIIDSLDTLWLMNMKKEYSDGRQWVENELSFGKSIPVNLFETTIRILGGLLSIYHLTADSMYLDKAEDLGDRLMGAFKSTSKIPFSDVILGDKTGRPPMWGADSSLSEVATIQLEFKDLSYLLNNPTYTSAAENVILQIISLPMTSGLAPIFINAGSGEFRAGSHITLGARGDSYYEYLLKKWIQTGKKENYLRDEYLKAMLGVKKLLVRKSEPGKLTYVGELLSGRIFSPKMDHLVCFLPGTLALGYFHGLPKWHMDLAKELIETCYQMYARMETGLSPEIVFFNQNAGGGDDIHVKSQDAHNLLRPETVESLHMMYSITKDKKYQEQGWKIFQAFQKYSKVASGGYVSLNDVRNSANPRPGENRDKMESFFLAETLKYLFLLFGEQEILPLDKFVFNTEAHPLPIIKP